MSTSSPPNAPDPFAAGPVPEPATSTRPWRSWVVAGVVTGVVAAGAAMAVGASSTSDGGAADVVAEASSASSATVDAGAGTPAGGGFDRGGFGGAIVGTVTAVGDGTVTVTPSMGEATIPVVITVDDDTVVTDSVVGHVGDLVPGDAVVVRGETTDGVLVAVAVSQGEEAGPFGGGPGGAVGARRSGGPSEGAATPDGATRPTPSEGAARGAGFAEATTGTLSAVDGTNLIVTLDDGTTVSVHTDGDTAVTITTTITAGDLVVGDDVVVLGGAAADDGLPAVSIRRGAVTMGLGTGGSGRPGGAGGGARPGAAVPTTTAAAA